MSFFKLKVLNEENSKKLEISPRNNNLSEDNQKNHSSFWNGQNTSFTESGDVSSVSKDYSPNPPNFTSQTSPNTRDRQNPYFNNQKTFDARSYHSPNFMQSKGDVTNVVESASFFTNPQLASRALQNNRFNQSGSAFASPTVEIKSPSNSSRLGNEFNQDSTPASSVSNPASLQGKSSFFNPGVRPGSRNTPMESDSASSSPLKILPSHSLNMSSSASRPLAVSPGLSKQQSGQTQLPSSAPTARIPSGMTSPKQPVFVSSNIQSGLQTLNSFSSSSSSSLHQSAISDRADLRSFPEQNPNYQQYQAHQSQLFNITSAAGVKKEVNAPVLFASGKFAAPETPPVHKLPLSPADEQSSATLNTQLENKLSNWKKPLPIHTSFTHDAPFNNLSNPANPNMNTVNNSNNNNTNLDNINSANQINFMKNSSNPIIPKIPPSGPKPSTTNDIFPLSPSFHNNISNISNIYNLKSDSPPPFAFNKPSSHPSSSNLFNQSVSVIPADSNPAMLRTGTASPTSLASRRSPPRIDTLSMRSQNITKAALEMEKLHDQILSSAATQRQTISQTKSQISQNQSSNPAVGNEEGNGGLIKSKSLGALNNNNNNTVLPNVFNERSIFDPTLSNNDHCGAVVHGIDNEELGRSLDHYKIRPSNISNSNNNKQQNINNVFSSFALQKGTNAQVMSNNINKKKKKKKK